MRKTFTLLIALMALCVSSWGTTSTITWNAGNGLTSIDLNEYTNNYWENEYHSYNIGTKTAIIEGVAATISATADGASAGFYTYEQNEENITSISISNGGTLTFSSALYKIQSIVINFTGVGSITGWSENTANTLTWTGEATHSVEVTNAYISGITSIVFTVEAVQTTTVSWNQTDISMISLTSSTQGDTQTASAIKGITASLTRTSGPADEYDHCQFTYREPWISNSGELTFTSSVGNILGIVITCDEAWSHDYLPAGWAYKDGNPKTYSWIGAASSAVTLSGYIDFSANSIEFIMAASSSTSTTTTTTITWDQSDVASVHVYQNSGYEEPQSQTVKEISVTAAAPASGDYSQFFTYDNNSYLSVEVGGTLTFTAPEDNKLTRIIVSCGTTPSYPENVSDGWTWNDLTYKLVWSGDAASSVTLACNGSTGTIYFGSITSVEFTVVEDAAPVTPTPTTTTIEWDDTEVQTVVLNCSNVNDIATSSAIDGITASLKKVSSGSHCEIGSSIRDLWITDNCGELTFTSSVGDISGIVITSDHIYTTPSNLPAGWTYDDVATTLTWTGTASSQVTLSETMDLLVYSIEFTVVDASAPVVPPTPAGPSFTWQAQQINHVSLYPQSVSDTETTPVIKNVITSLTRTGNGEFCRFDNEEIVISNCGELTFQSIVGDITGIVITCNTSYYLNVDNLPADWTYNDVAGTLTWSGTAAESVTLSGTLDLTLTSIEFSYTPAAAPYLGDEFYGYNYHKFKVTGPKTVSMPAQFLNGSLLIPSTVEYMGNTYYVTDLRSMAK